jgi:hypothetical protein
MPVTSCTRVPRGRVFVMGPAPGKEEPRVRRFMARVVQRSPARGRARPHETRCMGGHPGRSLRSGGNRQRSGSTSAFHVVLDGAFPAGLEARQEAGFDAWCDVGVGLVDLVVEGVAEAAGLGDLGDAVFDQPCLVGVP